MDNPTILFILEGQDENNITKYMTNCFFKGHFKAKIINLPIEQNIYMLYNILKEDNFETDFVEILRETVLEAKCILEGIPRQDIQEIFLFFDFDPQQNNVKYGNTCDDVIGTLINTFDNETENGKLYINYPMLESIYDFSGDRCLPFTSCYIKTNQLSNYKRLVGKDNPMASVHYKINDWKNIVNSFYLKILCFFNKKELCYEDYKNDITANSIYNLQKDEINENKRVFVLNAFSEFLLDYFNINFWNSVIRRKKLINNCKIKSQNLIKANL